MDVFSQLLIKLLPLYLYIFIGYLGGKLFKIKNNFVTSFLLYILIPFVIFNSASTTTLTTDVLSIPLLFIIICCIASCVVYIISGYIWKDTTKNLLAFIAGTANTGYLGFAVVSSLFGNNYLYVAILAVMGTTLYFNTIGFLFAAKGKHTTKESLIKLFKLPILYAFSLGILLSALNIHFSKEYLKIATIANEAYVVLGMMTIGLALAEIKKYTFDYKFIGVSLGAKYLLWPLLMVVLLFLDSQTFKIYDYHLYKILFIMSLLPVAVNIVPYAIYLKENSEKSAVVVIITTLLALIFIPLVASIL